MKAVSIILFIASIMPIVTAVPNPEPTPFVYARRLMERDCLCTLPHGIDSLGTSEETCNDENGK
jgi:hypothetical protein